MNKKYPEEGQKNVRKPGILTFISMNNKNTAFPFPRFVL